MNDILKQHKEIQEQIEMRLNVNPGTQDLNESTEANAVNNMRQFIFDSPVQGLTFDRASELDDGGRYGFKVKRPNYDRVVNVQMPGWEIELVRFIGHDQNPYHYPRLYKNGSSWLWCFALIVDDDWRTE